MRHFLKAGGPLCTALVPAITQNRFQLHSDDIGETKGSFPVFTSKEVEQKVANTNRIWVTHKDGVYDVTEFLAVHPGCEMLLAARGGPLEHLWAHYHIHISDGVWSMLEDMRIGTLDIKDRVDYDKVTNPFCEEPVRSPALKTLSQYPFDAETPKSILARTYHTPSDVFYVRNHFPVPQLEDIHVRLSVCVPADVMTCEHDISRTYEIDELMSLPCCEVDSVLSCAGFRGKDMTLSDVDSDGGQMGNALWKGVRVRDLLLSVGVDEHKVLSGDSNGWHLHVLGHDGFEMSIPLEVAIRLDRDVILATEMNGQPLLRDHGAPVRLLVPGMVGARSVKWVSQIKVCRYESTSPWHRRIYRIYDQEVKDIFGVRGLEPEAPPCMEVPLNSLILEPRPDEVIKPDAEKLQVRGVALPSGGRRIVRVEVSAEGGIWHHAKLERRDYPWGHSWAWCPWQVELPISDLSSAGKRIRIQCRAVDESMNTQPSAQVLWNFRGYQCNSYHTIVVSREQRHA